MSVAHATEDVARRRLRLHHLLYRRRRYSKALDNLLGPRDPWEYSEPIDWHATGMDLTVRQREGP